MPLTSCRRALAAASLTAAVLAAACGSADTSSTTSPAAAAPSPAASTSTGSAACSTGSGRSDDFSQKVTLTKLPDGLQIGDITVGGGEQVKAGQTLAFQYSGWLQDGTLFDSSRQPGRQPLTTVLGAHRLVPGFEEALTTMRVGGVRRALIPPELGYGASGTGPIPPNATLTFDIELVCAR